MFRSFRSKDRASKAVKSVKKTYKEHTKAKLQRSLEEQSPAPSKKLISPIITFTVGADKKLFAAHEDILCLSPFFAAALKGLLDEGGPKRVSLPEEEPVIFSCVLEYLYHGDYHPYILRGKRHGSRQLEDVDDFQKVCGRGSVRATFIGRHGVLLRDTAVYCLAEKLGLADLKRIAHQKQGLQSGIPRELILRSARFTYENTPNTDSSLRSHFVTLIVRQRDTFAKSRNLQMEMEIGGSRLFFDLFVAMSNHMDELVVKANRSSPRTI